LTGTGRKILIYGYGNPGRQDDGAGVVLAEQIESWAHEQGISRVSTDSNYQLNLEDASAISEYDIVIFADASQSEINDFLFERLEPSASVEFTMHAVAPSFILHLCKQVFDRSPETYILHIKGYSWEFMNDMTEQAKANTNDAIQFLKKFILDQ
jgi:hydrogenase maturation protease